MSNNNRHEIFEKSVPMLVIGIIFAISLGWPGRDHAAVLPEADQLRPVEGLKAYTALQMEGRDIYIREGCTVCHSQMIRPFRAETERYGHYSVAGESVWEHPFLWGSKRTGPDLARVGGRYSDDWHRAHLINPRDVVPESNMPAFPWLAAAKLEDGPKIAPRMQALRKVGVPYTDAEIKVADDEVKGKTELEAVIAYLQVLGTAVK
jgi:cytochrome c oxidase cbb3-type subunit 2